MGLSKDNSNQINIGIGHISGGKITDNVKIAGVINEVEQQNLADTVVEIQALIQQLEQSHPTNTTTEKMIVASKVIEKIESTPGWKQKAISALTQGSLKVLETNPIGAFIVGAIKGWQDNKVK